MSARYAGPVETDLEPDDDMVFRFLGWWFNGCNRGAVELGWVDPSNGKLSLFRRFDLSDIAEATRFACETNTRPGCSMYYRPATVRPDSEYTYDQDVIQIPGTWTDCDDIASVERVLTAADPRPTAQVITGHVPSLRGQFLWKLSEPIIVADWSRELNRQACALSQGDSKVINVSTLLRLPGSITWPYKPGRVAPELTEWCTPNRGGSTFTLDALRHALPQVPPEAEAPKINGTAIVCSTTELLNPVRALMEQAKAGPRWHDPVLRLVAAMVARGTPDWQIMAMAGELTWPGYTVEQTRAEMRQMIDGAIRKYAPDQAGDAADGDAAADVMDVAPEAATGKLFPLLTDQDLDALPDPTFLIPDVLVADTLCVIYGPWASFKSFVALDAALCLATGRPWLDRQVIRSDVLYVAGEGAAGLKLRVAAWKRHRGVAEHIAGFRVIPLAVNLMEQAEAERLILSAVEAERVSGFHPKVVFIDTLHRSMPGAEENAAKDMGVAISNGALIQRQLGCALVPVHHSGKDAERGMRGSSGLPGAADTILQVTRDGMAARLLVEKQKDAEDGQTFGIRAETIDLPPAAGSIKPRSSLVMVPSADAPARQDVKLKPTEKKAIEILTDLIAAEGEPLPGTSGFPQGVRGVWENRWRSECETRRLSTRELLKERNRVFREAYAELLERKRVAAREGWVWLAKEDYTHVS